MNLRLALTAPPVPINPWLRHGYLWFCLVLLGWHWNRQVRHGWRRDHDIIELILVALLLNHLAFRFCWPRPAIVGLRLVAWAWLAYGAVRWLLLVSGN